VTESMPPRIGPGSRPGGRTAEVTARVNKAVLDLIIEGGAKSCSYARVAKRSGIDRSTLYRRYPDRWEMMIDAFMARAGADIVPDLKGSFAADLKLVLTRLVEILESPIGPALLSLAGEMRAAHAGDYSRAYFDRRIVQLDPMFDAAIERGELPAAIDREELFTFAAGAVYFRLFIAARPVDDAWLDALVEKVCWLYCAA
jgi:AcrR family transcriptional regulator